MELLTIENFFPWDKNFKRERDFKLFLDIDSRNAEFTFVLYMISVLKRNETVFLLCCNKPKKHYHYVLKKNVTQL